LRPFLNKHTQLSFKLQGAKSFSPERVASFFFNIYDKETEEMKFALCRFYNADETEIRAAQSKHTEINTTKGKWQTAALHYSQVRGCLAGINNLLQCSSHNFVSVILFPTKNMKAKLMLGAFPEAIHTCHPTGWAQQETLTKRFSHFLQYVKPSKNNPVILVLDGRYSETRNADVINMARDNRVSVIGLQPLLVRKCNHLM
jgi:hypothetical protein